jgi:hypothetical protein
MICSECKQPWAKVSIKTEEGVTNLEGCASKACRRRVIFLEIISTSDTGEITGVSLGPMRIKNEEEELSSDVVKELPGTRMKP